MNTKEGPDQGFDELMIDQDKTILTIVRHVSAGGTLPGLCDVWGVRYADVIAWLQGDKNLHSKYSDSIAARGEWAKEEVFEELRRMSKSRIVDFFDDAGALTDVKTWTPEMKGLIKKIKYNDDGEIEQIEFWNKEKALELLGKNMKMFTETHSISGKFSLEDLVQISREGDDE